MSAEEIVAIARRLGLEVPPAHDYSQFLQRLALENKAKAQGRWKKLGSVAVLMGLRGTATSAVTPAATVPQPVALVDPATGVSMESDMSALEYQMTWQLEAPIRLPKTSKAPPRRPAIDPALNPREQEEWKRGCFGPSVRIAMADGTQRRAADVRVGDCVATADGGVAQVEATMHQLAGGAKGVVCIRGHGNDSDGGNDGGGDGDAGDGGGGGGGDGGGGDGGGGSRRLLISPMHRVQYDGAWMAASDVPGAAPMLSPTSLHNFVVRGRHALVADGVVVSTLGQVSVPAVAVFRFLLPPAC